MSPAEALRLLQVMQPTVLALMPGMTAAANDLLQVRLLSSCIHEMGCLAASGGSRPAAFCCCHPALSETEHAAVQAARIPLPINLFVPVFEIEAEPGCMQTASCDVATFKR